MSNCIQVYHFEDGFLLFVIGQVLSADQLTLYCNSHGLILQCSDFYNFCEVLYNV